MLEIRRIIAWQLLSWLVWIVPAQHLKTLMALMAVRDAMLEDDPAFQDHLRKQRS
ncbi:hypothetical protein [Aureimonas endophytica]|uniref:hypothetical protein n=1 Tax=Aureimonas endophytica TaxID=2027858 RepID=UPI001665C7B2|nr:hypothetical protein [Aureimonas endophytica]